MQIKKRVPPFLALAVSSVGLAQKKDISDADLLANKIPKNSE